MKRKDENVAEKPTKLKAQKGPAKKNATKEAAKPKKNAKKKDAGVSIKNEKEAKRGKYEKALAKTDKVKKIKQKETEQTEGEKPNWLEVKKQRKELKQKRKAKKLTDVYEASAKAKQLSEKLRRSDCSDKERTKLTVQLHGILRDNYKKIVYLHDMSRVVQWLIRYASPEVRTAILNELKPSLVDILQSKYAKNCIRSLLKYSSPELISTIITSCYGSMIKLVSHSVSAPIIENMYSTHATEEQKICMKQEFYGDMFKKAKDKNIKMLTDVFHLAAEMKPATLSAVKGNLIRILNKKLIESSLVHTVLYEFLRDCSQEDREEMIVMIRDSIVELSKSKFGAKAAVISIWHGTNKDRKIMMKALKDNIKDISISEHGHIILLALFDSIDDTVLLRKIVLSEILANLEEIAVKDHGKRVILYLVARRNSHYFPPKMVKYLQQGDNNATSKKPAELREEELLEAVKEPLLKSVTEQTQIWLSGSSIGMVTLAILKAGRGESLRKAFESVAKYVLDPSTVVKEDEVEYNIAEHAGLHMVLKKLVQYDNSLLKLNECTFGEVLINELKQDTIKKWIQFNRGCFLFVLLIENESETSANLLIDKLKPYRDKIQAQTNPGAKILLKKLQIN